MRRAVLLSPVALLTSACLRPPSEPATAETWSSSPSREPVAGAFSTQDALQRWHLPPGDPWAAYAKYTLLTALDAGPRAIDLPYVQSLPEVEQATRVARTIAEKGLPVDTLWIVDLRGAASVAFGAELSRAAREPVSVVPTFNNWPAENELVPAEEALSALAAFSPELPADGAPASRPVFLLDAWRLAYVLDDPGEDTYDNRYMLGAADLPDAAALRARGIRRVLYVVQSLGDTPGEKDDLHQAFLAYDRAGIPIAMVDLDTLDDLDTSDERVASADWDSLWVLLRLSVDERVTILEQPYFYHSARGAFGGVHARPSPVHVGWGAHAGFGRGSVSVGGGGYGGHGAGRGGGG
jgi:hypothetical protein